MHRISQEARKGRTSLSSTQELAEHFPLVHQRSRWQCIARNVVRPQLTLSNPLDSGLAGGSRAHRSSWLGRCREKNERQAVASVWEVKKKRRKRVLKWFIVNNEHRL